MVNENNHEYKKLKNLIFTIIGIVLICVTITYIYLYNSEKELNDKISNGHNTSLTNLSLNESAVCGDQCLIDYATFTLNSDYCENVSDSRNDECWGIFANDSTEACLELIDYDKKRMCIEEIAVDEEDIEICDYLDGQDEEICRDKVVPPCLNIDNKEERELCLALSKNSTAYCSEVNCVVSFAKEKKDAGVCEQLDNEAEKASCNGVISNLDECMYLNGTITKDYCYQLLAQYSGNYYFCDDISNGEYKFNCFTSAAIAKENMAYCSQLQLNYYSQCYREYSLTLHNIDACLAIDPVYRVSSRDGCIFDYANEFDDPGSCQYLSTIYMRTNCYANVIWSAENLSISKCYNVPNQAWQEKCFSKFAELTNSIEICNYITQNEAENKICIEGVTVSAS
ncbi:hypothetical protein KJ780_01505 [Candidatus Micrarchaeota archaeon]|nr:hypothetical protein [Candidatus Micrarchaeota archaeon]